LCRFTNFPARRVFITISVCLAAINQIMLLQYDGL
jgi:hypothetical protein